MTARGRARSRIAAAAGELLELSHRIHAHAEIAWQEYRTGAWLADALPGLGHACGHNVIAAAAIGAATGLADVADQLGLTVTILGTPAEKGGGGKILMLDRGAFDGLHAAMMIHPGPADVARAEPFAVDHQHVSYQGASVHASAHAAAYPDWALTPPTRSLSRKSRSACSVSSCRRQRGCTASSPRPGPRPTPFPNGPRDAGTCARPRWPNSTGSSRACVPASRQARLPPAAS